MPPVDPGSAAIEYDAATDTLFFRRVVAPATSVNIDGELWLRVDPHSGEVYGLEIEAFRQDFLKRHKDIGKLWKPLAGASDLTLANPAVRRLIDAIWHWPMDGGVPALTFA